VQARTAWHPPGGTLGRLSAQAAVRAGALRSREAELRDRLALAPAAPSLEGALRSGDSVALIGEIKRRSPSKGVLDPSIDAPARAAEFARAGAAAISVLTEPGDFGGSNDDLVTVRQAVQVPVLRKDFHVHPIQLHEAKALGASAALLIMRALGPEGTALMASTARSIGIEAVFEVRSEEELNWALDVDARLIGVNRRNLETLEIEDDVIRRIIPLVPPDRVAIAESGISTAADVADVAALGADAVLVGSFLSAAGNVADSVRTLAGIPRGSLRHG
jgi:indole-3-glycerol phosphate synthase